MTNKYLQKRILKIPRFSYFFICIFFFMPHIVQADSDESDSRIFSNSIFSSYRINIGPSYVGTPYSDEEQFVSFTNLGDFNGDNITDLLISGWTYLSHTNSTLNNPSNFTIITQNSDKSIVDSTLALVGNQEISGVGQPAVADFNLDGIDDFLLLGFTDFPVIPVPGKLYLSSPNGFESQSFKEMAIHGTAIGDWNSDGLLDVFGAGYGRPNPLLINNGNGFDISQELHDRGQYGSSVAMGDLTGDGIPELVISDVWYNGKSENDIVIFPRNADNSISESPVKILTAALGIDSHEARTYLSDLNQDGRLDLIVYETLFPTDADTSPSARITIFRNDGELTFYDVTSEWLPEQDVLRTVDYSMQWKDFDGDGSTDLSLSAPTAKYKHNNSLYLNDGSGHLHLAIQDEFEAVANNISEKISDATGLLFFPHDVGRFKPFVNSENNLDFYWTGQSWGTGKDLYISALIDANINIGERFVKSIEVLGSSLEDKLHGWSGNDTFTGLSGDDYIDGGGGIDTATYQGNLLDYVISMSNERVIVADERLTNSLDNSSTHDGTDTLVNVERLQFADTSLALDLNVGGSAGKSVQIITAAFGSFSLTPEYIGVGISIFDTGMSMLEVSQLILDSPQFQAIVAPTDTIGLIQHLVHNVLNREATDGDITYVSRLLDLGMTKAELLAAASGMVNTESISSVEFHY